MYTWAFDPQTKCANIYCYQVYVESVPLTAMPSRLNELRWQANRAAGVMCTTVRSRIGRRRAAYMKRPD